MALGADATRVLRAAMRQAAFQILVGLAIGIGATAISAAIVGPTALREFLFNVNPLDPPTYLAVAVLVTVVGVASCLLPACRAARVDPIIALRAE
jgi:putative ABC transport system permease protein